MRRTGRFRHVSVYYRDSNKVMRKIPGLVLFIDDGVLVKVYTLIDGKKREIELE